MEGIFGIVQGYTVLDESAGWLHMVLIGGSTGNAVVWLDVARWEAEAAGSFPR